MSRISLTKECAAALEEARWSTRSECTSDLLAAALDGSQTALKAIAEGWPADTAGERTDFPWIRPAEIERLSAMAHDAPEQPRRRGPKGAGIDGITEMLRRAREV